MSQQKELEAIQQQVDLKENLLVTLHRANQEHISFEEFYELPFLCEKILSNNYNR